MTRSVRRYILLLALAAVTVVSLSWWGDAPAIPAVHAALLFAAATWSILSPVWLRGASGQGHAITFEEMILVAALFALPGPLVPALLGAAAVVANLIAREPALKVAYNGATAILGAAAAVATIGFVGSGVTPLAPRSITAAVVAVAVFNTVQLLLLSELFRRLHGTGPRQVLESAGRLSWVTASINLLFGLLLATAIHVEPWSAVAAPALVALVTIGSDRYAAVLDGSERALSVHSMTATLADITAGHGSLDGFVAGVSQAMGAREAQLALFGSDGHRTIHAAGTPASELLESARSSGEPVVRTEPATDGAYEDAVAVGFAIGEDRRGVLAVLDRLGPVGWAERDVALLRVLAEHAAVALRNRELFASLEAERRRLAEETRKVTEILRSSSDGIALIDLRGTVIAWNPALEIASGVGEDDAIGAPWHELLRAGDPDLNLPPKELLVAVDAARDGHRVGPVDAKVMRARDDERWLRCTMSPVEREGEGVVGVVLVARDVTAEHELETLKADFVAIVSHELRTPLTPLRGFIETARSRRSQLTDEQLGTMFESMARQVDRLQTLVADLLTVADLDRGELTLRKDVIDVAEVAAAAVDVEGTPDRVRLSVSSRSSTVIAARTPVLRVIRALVSNAIKHTDGPVEVTVSADDEEVRVAVRDHGPGIAPWLQHRIFERFARVGDHLSWSTQGVGLGLSIARSLAEQLDGVVSVDSQVGEGATFTFALPAAPTSSDVVVTGSV